MKRVTRRLLATCLSAAMMTSVIPFAALADETDESQAEQIEQEEQTDAEEDIVPEEPDDEDVIDTEEEDTDEVLDGSTIEVDSWDELYTALEASGTYKITLTNNCTFNPETDSAPLVVASGTDVTIDLNGCKIDRALSAPTPGGNVITNEGTLTIMDSSDSQTGSIQGGYNAMPGGGIISQTDTSILTIESGSIQKNNTMAVGGGIYAVNSNSVVTMNGGSIRENFANYGGSGIYNSGSVTITSGSISYNDCGTGTGSGVYTAGGPFTMSGGEISHNTSNGQGAGIYYGNSGSLTLIGGSICDNTTTSSAPGAGVFLASGRTNNVTFGGSGTTPLIINGNKGNSKINNVFVSNNTLITVNALAEGSSIGISMQTPGTFTQDLNPNSFSAFASDAYGSMIIKDANSEAMLADKCLSILGYKLSVGSSITIDYYVSIPETIVTDPSFAITFTGDGIPTQTVKYVEGTTPEADGADLPGTHATSHYYVFSVDVPAACMTSQITATVSYLDNSIEISEDDFSIQRYAKYLLEKSSDWQTGYDQSELEQLLASLLNYGAYAQRYFGVNEDNYANANVSADYKDVIPDSTNVSTATSSEDPVGSLSFYKASLLCNADTTLKYYFLLPNAEANLSDYTIYVNDEEVSSDDIKINQNPNYFTISIPVSAKNYETKYTVTVSYAGEAAVPVCSYSVSDCVATICSNTEDADLKNLLYALHAYGTAAQVFNVGN